MTKGSMTIGELSERAHVNIETLRYYERRGLLPSPPRSTGNYRQFPPEAVQVVRFIKRAQELGFTLKEVEELLSLRSVPQSRCADVQKLAHEKIRDIEAKMALLQAMRDALSHVVSECPAQAAIQECPILEALAAEEN